MIFCTINRPIFGVFFGGGGNSRKPAEFVGFWWEKVYKKNQGF